MHDDVVADSNSDVAAQDESSLMQPRQAEGWTEVIEHSSSSENAPSQPKEHILVVSAPERLPDDDRSDREVSPTADVDVNSHKPSVQATDHQLLTPPYSKPPLSNPAGRSSLTMSDDRRLSDTLRANLDRLSKDLAKVRRKRLVAQEEGKQMQILHGQLLDVLYKFMTKMEAVRGRVDETIAKELPDWDDCLLSIEECVEENAETGKRFERNQEGLIKLESKLGRKEVEVLGKDDVRSSMDSTKRVSLDDVVEASEDSHNGRGSERESAEMQRFLALAKQSEDDGADDLTMPEDTKLDDLLNAHEDFEEAPDDPILDEPRDEFFDTDEDFEKLYWPVNDADFSQFMETDISALIEQARKASLVLRPGYSQNDLDRFFRWLAYGRPWSDSLGARESPTVPERPLPASMVTMFRTWIMHMLELLSRDLQPDDQGETSKTLNFARLRRFWAKDWQWDPWALPSALAQRAGITAPRTPLQEAQVNPEDEEDQKLDNILPLFDPPSVVPTTHANTAAAHRGGSDKKVAMSEFSHDHTGKRDWQGQLSRSRAGSSV